MKARASFSLENWKIFDLQVPYLYNIPQILSLAWDSLSFYVCHNEAKLISTEM